MRRITSIALAGRPGGYDGVAITFINPDDMRKFARIEQLIEREIVKSPLPEELGEARSGIHAPVAAALAVVVPAVGHAGKAVVAAAVSLGGGGRSGGSDRSGGGRSGGGGAPRGGGGRSGGNW